MHVCKQKYFTKYIYVCLDMHVCRKNTSQNIYMYVQVARYLGYACIQQKYLTKHIYVCLGSKIPWTRMYIAKYLTKIYVCLGSKIPHEKKESEQEKKKKKTNTDELHPCKPYR